jgi:oligogalacturonide transport system ATP-binding protein
LLDRLPKQLSGGQAQRVAVGRAIIKQPELFLFDEPLSNLDAKLRAAMRVRLIDLHRQLKAAGRPATVVYVTHDQTEAMTMGDRICVMKDGLIMQVADPVTLYERPANAFVGGFIGSPEMNLIEATLTAGESGREIRFGGQSLPVGPGLAKRIASVPEGTYTLGIRPQHLSIAGGNAPGTLEGKILHVEFLGHEVYLHVMVEGRNIIVVVPAADFDRTRIGNSSIRLSPHEDRLHLFDIESGRNVSLDDGTSINNGRKQ